MTHRNNRLVTALLFAAATYAIPQAFAEDQRPQAEPADKPHTSSVVQIVALDECDPATFNAALGPGLCKNVALAALGFATTLPDLFAKAAIGSPGSWLGLRTGRAQDQRGNQSSGDRSGRRASHIH